MLLPLLLLLLWCRCGGFFSLFQHQTEMDVGLLVFSLLLRWMYWLLLLLLLLFLPLSCLLLFVCVLFPQVMRL